MNILVLTPFFYPHTGGSQQYMEEMYAEILKNHPDITADVLCYNTTKSTTCERYRKINIYRVPCLNILKDQFSIPYPTHLIKFLINNRKKYQILHCSTRFFDTAWWGPIYAKMIRKPVILTDHCANYPIHQNKSITLVATLIDKTMSGFFLNFFDSIYTTNKTTQKFLLKNFNKRSKVIYGGIDTTMYKTKKLMNNKRLKIIFVGRMIDSKGPRYIFDIAKDIKSHDFYFAGPGPLEEKFRQEVENESLTHIKVLGKLNRNEVSKLMNKSDILVHPSYHHEGFPNVLTEAGASRLAVIATDTGGTKEIIIKDKTGLLIEPNNPKVLKENLNKLINNSSLRYQLSTNLYNYLTQNFTWKKVSEQLYKELINFTC